MAQNSNGNINLSAQNGVSHNNPQSLKGTAILV